MTANVADCPPDRRKRSPNRRPRSIHPRDGWCSGGGCEPCGSRSTSVVNVSRSSNWAAEWYRTFISVTTNMNPPVFKLAVANSRRPQHLDAATLEVVQVVGVVDSSLSVGFVIGHAELQRVDEKWFA